MRAGIVESKVDDAFLKVFHLACATYKERPDTQVLVFRCSAKLAITLVIVHAVFAVAGFDSIQ